MRKKKKRSIGKGVKYNSAKGGTCRRKESRNETKEWKEVEGHELDRKEKRSEKEWKNISCVGKKRNAKEWMVMTWVGKTKGVQRSGWR